MGSALRAVGEDFEIGIGMLPQAELHICAKSAVFYSGDVPGLIEIPDYGVASEDELVANLAQWGSEFHPVHAVFLDPNPYSGKSNPSDI